MRTIIAGSREAFENDTLAGIDSCPWKAQISLVVSGTARGADYWGERWAEENKIPIKRYYPDWNRHGKSAGPIRNQEMAENARINRTFAEYGGSVENGGCGSGNDSG